MAYRLASIVGGDHDIMRKPVSLVSPDHNPCNQDDNYYSILIGNNGCGKTTLLKRISLYYSNKLKKQYYTFSSIGSSVTPQRTIVTTRVIGDSFPNDLSNDQSYGGLDYVYLGARVASGGYMKKHLLERTAKILIEDHNDDMRGVYDDVLNFVGYEPLATIEYAVSKDLIVKNEFQYDRIKKKLDRAKVNISEHAVGNLFGDRKTISVYLDLTYGVVDLHGAYGRYGDPRDTIKLIFELRRAGVLTLEKASVMKGGMEVSFDDVSSGEANLLTGLLSIAYLIKDNSLLLIDEPELSLHPGWQNLFIPKLDSILSKRKGCHTIVATHSHFILSDIDPSRSSVVKLSIENDGNATYIMSKILEYSPFSWSAENILTEVFNTPGTRNYYLACHVQKALDMLAENRENDLSFQEELRIIRDNSYNIKKNDPLFTIIDRLTKYER